MKSETKREEVKAQEALVKATEAYEVVHTAYKAAKALYEAAWGELTATPEWAAKTEAEAAYVAAKLDADAALKASREAKAIHGKVVGGENAGN